VLPHIADFSKGYHFSDEDGGLNFKIQIVPQFDFLFCGHPEFIEGWCELVPFFDKLRMTACAPK